MKFLESKKQLQILLTMYLGYGAMMICRQMITILSPAILADPELNFTKTHIGDFAAYGTIGALVGKLIWGPLTDKIGGRLTFLIGIVLTAVFVLAFGLSQNVLVFTFFSFLLYLTKSAGWPAMTKLVGNWYKPSTYGKVWGVLSTSSRASVVLGTLFFGKLMAYYHWRTVAYIAAGFAIGVFLINRIFLSETPKEKITESEEKTSLPSKTQHALEGKTLTQGLMAFAKSHRVWLVIIMMQNLTCMMAFLDFVPVYLMEVYKLSPSNASMASSVFPLGSLAGLIISVFLYDKFSRKGIRLVLGLSLVAATLCVLVLQYLPLLNLTADQNFPVALIMILIFGFMISPAYYIPMSIFSIEFGGVFSATLVCILDAFGFGASAAFGFIGGRIADSSAGWSGFMNMLVVLCVLGIFSTWGFLHFEYKASKLVKA